MRKLKLIAGILNNLVKDVDKLANKWWKESKSPAGGDIGDTMQELLDRLVEDAFLDTNTKEKAFGTATSKLGQQRDDWYSAYNREGDKQKADYAADFDTAIADLGKIASKYGIKAKIRR